MDQTTINVIATCVLLILIVSGSMGLISFIRGRSASRRLGNKAIKVPLNEESARFDSESASLDAVSLKLAENDEMDLKLAKAEIFGSLLDEPKEKEEPHAIAEQFVTVKGLESDFAVKQPDPEADDQAKDEVIEDDEPLSSDIEEVEEEPVEVIAEIDTPEKESIVADDATGESPIAEVEPEDEVVAADLETIEAEQTDDEVVAEANVEEDEITSDLLEDAETIARDLVAEVLGDASDIEEEIGLQEVVADEAAPEGEADHIEEIEVHEDMPAFAARAVVSSPSIPLFTMAPSSVSEEEPSPVVDEAPEETVSRENSEDVVEAVSNDDTEVTSHDSEIEEVPQTEVEAETESTPAADFSFDEVPEPQEIDSSDILGETVSSQITQLDSDLDQIESLVAAIEASLAGFQPLDGIDLESEFDDEADDYSQEAA